MVWEPKLENWPHFIKRKGICILEKNNVHGLFTVSMWIVWIHACIICYLPNQKSAFLPSSTLTLDPFDSEDQNLNQALWTFLILHLVNTYWTWTWYHYRYRTMPSRDECWPMFSQSTHSERRKMNFHRWQASLSSNAVMEYCGIFYSENGQMAEQLNRKPVFPLKTLEVVLAGLIFPYVIFWVIQEWRKPQLVVSAKPTNYSAFTSPSLNWW